ncbi:MAG: 2-phospho-L-lactate transferase CofD family protein, partial [Candidatus Omnitrophica bacterium]|nr:2-phospho-L-lactate transferase CofD family protein [Candidatus Omnitrophota bacterium]
VGEKNIPRKRQTIRSVALQPQDAEPAPDALKAIREAQIIILGPGSLYTSIIPNLLVKELTQALTVSSAVKVHVCNVMTQPGESESYTASEHVRAMIAHSNPRVLNYCVVNTGVIPPGILKRYARDGSYPVVNDRRKVEKMGYRVIEDDFVAIEGDVIRHDPVKLARIILGLMEEI